jgi:hypothetical protein
MPLSVEMTEASMSMADVDMSTMVTAKKTFSLKSFWDTLSFTLAACAGITAILAMAWAGSTIVNVAMSISLILSSAATVQRFKLSRQESKLYTTVVLYVSMFGCTIVMSFFFFFYCNNNRLLSFFSI